MRMIYKNNIGHTVKDAQVKPLIDAGFTMLPNGPVTKTVYPTDVQVEALIAAAPKKPTRKAPKKKLED